ncbi:hypothetical protein CIL05_07230 [Virgibacillus profundi]|uniref:Uncharacterized protein n=1 Tax=Virgibacillus profundi TaxID=2024555 RepID=A0A2A2IGN9_9BACI|nr:hypothetical protein [Virgibacillus profundi]PAV30253.1 hypothetical protein CIL05_07230 [Virgibacillus profundi]PXY54425.1 hypothetical protein CIT14_07315 [Virgibacillus profundi]
MNIELINYLEQRIEQSNNLKFSKETHKADQLFFNGQEQAFKEIVDYLQGKYFINVEGKTDTF